MRARRVLIVDDERLMREFISETVSAAGFQPLVAEDLDGAMALVQENSFDVLLLDVDLDGASGIDLCRKVREIDPVVPILFVTGTEASASDAFAAGCDDLVRKPIEIPVLLARMRGHIERMDTAKQLHRTHKLLEHYVSRRTREVVQSAVHGRGVPAATTREVTVMFTDVRGFTALSEVMAPDTLFSLLSSQLARQVHLVHECGGYVDKFGGDGLMAVFDSEDMAARACECAIRIMESARQGSSRDQALRQLGIGINKGSAVIGNIGSQEHLDYSVIGTTVNLAARLCGFASPMTIVVSKSVRDATDTEHKFHFEDERSVSIRGIHEHVTVYALQSRLT